MKNRKLLLILAVTTLSLTACKKEPTEVPSVEETVESVAEETTTEEVIPEATEETTEIETTVDETTIPEASIVGRLALPNNVTITSWGTNEFTGHKKALECTYSDEWAGAVMDVINTLQDGYIETLSEEKLDELIGTIALDAATIHGEDADDEEVTSTITEVFKVFRYLNAKAQQKENIDKIDQATGNQSSGGNQSSSGNGGGQSSNGAQNQGGGNQSQGGNSGQQNTPPADSGEVVSKEALEAAGFIVHTDDEQRGEFNKVPGLVVK